MGWLEPSLFDDNDEILLQAVRQYEQFICVEAVGMIARWDIDLIWHTHQLYGTRYRHMAACIAAPREMTDITHRDYTLRILGRILDHNDSQSQDVIGEIPLPEFTVSVPDTRRSIGS
jgi:hypothetical protein